MIQLLNVVASVSDLFQDEEYWYRNVTERLEAISQSPDLYRPTIDSILYLHVSNFTHTHTDSNKHTYQCDRISGDCRGSHTKEGEGGGVGQDGAGCRGDETGAAVFGSDGVASGATV